MKAKLIALSLIVIVMFAASQPLRAHLYVRSSAEADSIELLPPALDGYAISRNWKHPLGGTTIEEGALYTPLAEGASVQLDFYRNSGGPHNGAGCYLAQGQRLISQQMMTLPTGSGPESFLAAFMSDGRELSLAVTTECRATGCSEDLIQDGWGLEALGKLFAPPAPGVVPVSIVLRQSYDSRDDLGRRRTELLSRAGDVVKQLDLASARRLASHQSSFQ